MNKPLPSGTTNVFPVRIASCSVDHGHNGVKVDNQQKDREKKMKQKCASQASHKEGGTGQVAYQRCSRYLVQINVSIYQQKFLGMPFEVTHFIFHMLLIALHHHHL